MDDTQGDERGADVLAMREGRQALDVNSEQAREGVGLGVTELRELRCDMLHRAMSLAQLHAGQGCALSDRSGGGGETVGGQCRRQCLRAHGDVLARIGELRGIALLELVVAFVCEVAHGILASVFGKEAQGGGGDVVIVAAHAGMTGLGQDVCAGGPTSTAADTTSGGGLALLDRPLLGEQVEVTADRGWRQAQTRPEGGRGDRAVLGDRLPDPVPGTRLKTVLAGVGPLSRVGNAGGCDKHNTSVT